MSASQFDLTGRIALITGGSRGLGWAIAESFAAHGATVVLASRKGPACADAAAELTDRFGVTAKGLAFHAGRWEDATRLAAEVHDEFGRCDVLVNNAGMAPLYPNLSSVTEDLFDKVIGVNFKGPFRLASLIGERMVEQGGGSIVNVSSIAAIRPAPHELVYAGAKAALNAFTIGLAHAYGPTVRSNTIMPGPFLTDISKGWDQDAFEERARTAIPLQRAGRPDEIAGAALYLASDASTYTTGAVIKVDGGAAWSAA